MLEKFDQGVPLKIESWEDLASQESILIGRDIEIDESPHLWRGPIESVKIDDNNLTIKLAWSAELVHEAEDVWQYLSPSSLILGPSIGVNTNHGRAFDQPDGSIRLVAPMVWSATIMPAETKNLDPADVRGFDLAIV